MENLNVSDLMKRVLTTTLFGFLLFIACGNQVKAVEFSAPEVRDTVSLTRVTSSDGFVHPGISVSADNLENTRSMLLTGTDPWWSYYEAMAQAGSASQSFVSKNLSQGTLDTPKDASFKSSAQNVNLSADGFTAYTQALMYYFTGESVYRYNALRLIRVWENMDPEQYEYYADAHIHVGTPFYYMVAAAELIRYTQPVDITYDDAVNNVTDYSLVWTETDTTKLTNNLINPITEKFLHSNYRYFNQHLYPLIGSTAGYIFTDNHDGYAEALEWFTVNSTTEKPETNGAISRLFSLIGSDHPDNPTGVDYVQHLEMGRDQAHGAGDVMDLTGLARMFYQQNTLIDPDTGTIAENGEGVTPYAYLDNRLLKGAENFYRYMAGYTIPWTRLGTGDYGGNPSEAYRGRTAQYFNLSEIYDSYRYIENMSTKELEELAPGITAAAKNLNAPVYYKGAVQENFWGAWKDNKMTEIGCEYWLSIPTARKDDLSLALGEPKSGNSNIQFEKRAALLDADLSSIKNTGEASYVRVVAVQDTSSIKESLYDSIFPTDTTTVRGKSQISLSSIVRPDEKTNPYMGLRIRSNGVAKLLISGDNRGSAPYQIIYLPDTKGEWTYVAYDSSLANKIQGSKRLDNMDFYTVIADKEGVKVDFDCLSYLNTSTGENKKVPLFSVKNDTTVQLIKGEKYESAFPATVDSSNITYALDHAPAGMKIDSATGVITWDNPKISEKPQTAYIKVSGEDIVDVVLKINYEVSEDRASALANVIADFDSEDSYTTETLQKYLDQKTLIENAVQSSNEEYLTLLEDLSTAITQLELLNPVSSDGSFNYTRYASIIQAVDTMKFSALEYLNDDNVQSFSGDVKAPIILDFGVNYSISAEKFELQARLGFPNRSQGTNIYGSNDKKNWTLLTENDTTNTEVRETLLVKEELKNKRFRYIKIQVDKAGTPTDVNYPNIASYSEFRIFGERHERVNYLSNVTLSSNGLRTGVVANGEKVTLAFEATTALSDVAVTIDKQRVTATNLEGNKWSAEYLLPDNCGTGDIGFTIDYTANGKTADTVLNTTDGSVLCKSDESNLLDLQSKYMQSTSGTATDIAKWFDNNVSTMFEVRKATAGIELNAAFATFDFSKTPVMLDRIEFMARQDQYSSRATKFVLRGSNDATNWSSWVEISTRGQNTTGWQTITVKDELSNNSYKYIQMYCWNEMLGITELRLFGSLLDYSDLQALYEEHNSYTQGNYTPESWLAFTDALTTAKSVLDAGNALQDDVDEAKISLATTISELVEVDQVVTKENLQTIFEGHKDDTQGNYTDASWQIYTDALTTAKSVLDKTDATQFEVDEAKAIFERSLSELVENSPLLSE